MRRTVPDLAIATGSSNPIQHDDPHRIQNLSDEPCRASTNRPEFFQRDEPRLPRSTPDNATTLPNPGPPMPARLSRPNQPEP